MGGDGLVPKYIGVGQDFGGTAPINAATPVNPTDVAIKSYVDANDARIYTAADFGWLAWTFDPLDSSASTPIVGRTYWSRTKVAKSGTIANIQLQVTTAGTTLTHGFVGIYSTAGVLLGSSADQTTAWQTTGVKTIAVTNASGQSLAVTAGQEILLAFLQAGTTGAAIAAKTSSPAVNAFLTGASLRAGLTAATGLTALPSPLILSTGTQNGNQLFLIAS